MTTEADALQRLEDALPVLRDAVDREHLGKSLRSTLDAIADLPQRIARLAALADSVALLKEHVGTRSEEILVAVDQIEDFGEAMTEAATSEGLDEVTRGAKRLEPPISSLHRAVIAVAGSYSRDNIVPLAALERLLHTLGRDDIADAVAILQKMDAALPSAGVALPTRLAELLAARASLAADLTTLANGSEADAFLTAFARKGSAPLEIITPGVLAWLSERGALKQFVVQAVT